MSEFLLIAPGDAVEQDLNSLLNIGITDSFFPDLQRGIGIMDLNDKLLQAGMLPEGMQVIKVTYLAEFNRIWFNYDKAE